ncbi:MAG: hypothetical protein HQL96_15545 [Magnetococcales bacterium]|nr:hypothetical protein [Magnetococcales bacterium]
MHKFNIYEFAGVITPGVLALFVAAIIYPDFTAIDKILNINIGGFGVIVFIAYIAGHLLQGLGNKLEKLLFFLLHKSSPSDWILSNENRYKLLSICQYNKLSDYLIDNYNFDINSSNDIQNNKWEFVYKQIHIKTLAADQDSRIAIFQGNVGLFRGVAIISIFFCLLSVCLSISKSLACYLTSNSIDDLAIDYHSLLFILISLLALLISIDRMMYFKIKFTSELLIQYLIVNENKESSSTQDCNIDESKKCCIVFKF